MLPINAEWYLNGTLAARVKPSAGTITANFFNEITKEARTPDAETRIFVIEPGTERAEIVICESHSTTGGLTTLATVSRNIAWSGYSLSAGSAPLFDHAAGAQIISAPLPLMMSLIGAILGGARSTGGGSLNIGSGADGELATLEANGVPFFRRNPATGKVQFSNNGTDWIDNDNSGVGVLDRGDGIGGTGDEIFVDLATDAGLEILAGKVAAKLKASGGLSVDEDGLAVNEADLSLGNLGEKNFGSLNLKRNYTFGEAVNGTTTPVLMSLNVTTAENKRYEHALQDTLSTVFGVNWFGNIFTTDAYMTHITKISLWMIRTGSPTGNLTLSLFATSGGLPTGSTLGTVTVSPSLVPTTAGYFDFTFSSPVSLQKNTTYAWTISHIEGTGSGNTVSLYRKNSGYYPNGTRIYSTNSGVLWTKDQESISTFAIWGYNISDGKIYKATTNDTTRQYPLGFCRENVSADATGGVQYFDVVGGFTGLTVGAKYYMQATAGTVGTSGSILVGTAISATEILLAR